MSENHGHDHSHSFTRGYHAHAPADQMGRAFFIILGVLGVEIAGGLISNSLALLSDAGHVLTDAAAVGLSWFAIRRAQKPPSYKMTYGYYRTGTIAAFINAVSLIIIALVIGWEAYGRIFNPEPVGGVVMLTVAVVGLLANLYVVAGMRGAKDLNVRSAVLHMAGDAAASAGVIAGGIIIALTGWYIIDPMISLGIALLIAGGAFRLIRETVAVFMESTPADIDLEQVIGLLTGIEGVRGVHDIHAWSIATGRNALSCHIVVDGSSTISEGTELLRIIEQELARLGICHSTIQFEDASHLHGKQHLCTL